MLVIRVSKTGVINHSKPCINCINYLHLFGIKEIYYSGENGEIIKEKVSRIDTDHHSFTSRRLLGLPNPERKPRPSNTPNFQN
jgi:deoxycytidylate deaminase